MYLIPLLILTQPDSEGKWGKWIAKIMEYDVDIKSTKLVKRKGLAILLAYSNCEALGIHLIASQPIQEELQIGQDKKQIMDKYAESEWYVDIVHFLLHFQCPSHLDKKSIRSLNLKDTKYCLINQQLHWKYLGGVLLMCLDKKRLKRSFQN